MEHVEPTVGVRVELEYQLTRQDMRQALRARAKVSAAERRLRIITAVVAVLMAANAVLRLADGRGPDFQLALGVYAVVALGVLRPLLMVRQFLKLATRHGGCRTLADDRGVTVTNAGGSNALNWTAASRYAETRDTFVLLSADKNASCLTVLPKRGAREAGGVDTLRALLDRHITRI
ncbi:YcxB family protein [Streptomyces sp. NPDC056002]|uniref:YcxB family protein n=1 Tax=Streptomyces sp. NPDC056002 TaxID=3345675 RepID=UPI0035DCFEBB